MVELIPHATRDVQVLFLSHTMPLRGLYTASAPHFFSMGLLTLSPPWTTRSSDGYPVVRLAAYVSWTVSPQFQGHTGERHVGRQYSKIIRASQQQEKVSHSIFAEPTDFLSNFPPSQRCRSPLSLPPTRLPHPTRTTTSSNEKPVVWIPAYVSWTVCSILMGTLVSDM